MTRFKKVGGLNYSDDEYHLKDPKDQVRDRSSLRKSRWSLRVDTN